MSTRAVFRFVSEGSCFLVYKHHDGYPEGAAHALETTINSGLAWGLPRYEADEFAAAFIAANKKQGGGYRLVATARDIPSDVEYIYEVTQAPGGTIIVSAWYASAYLSLAFNMAAKRSKPLFYGPLKDFIAEYTAT